jgi:hypothetical protein
MTDRKDPAADVPAAAAPGPDAAKRRSARRTLLLLAAIAIAPVAASYAVYYFFPRDVQANYGTLLSTAPAPELAGVRADGQPFQLTGMKGQWSLVINAGARCGSDCERMLYATRQARTMQGREQERVARLLVVTGADPLPQAIAEQHPALVPMTGDAGAVAKLPGSAPAILIVDPLGNLVLRYAADPDIKGLAKDLTRLLKASRIG